MGIEGTGSPSVSMRLGNDHADRQKQATQFNEEINQAKEAADDDVSSSETAPQRPRQFTNEQIYGETKAAEERIDKQIEEDRSNSKISKDETNSAARFAAAHGTKYAFPEPGRKGWAVHAESPPKDGLGWELATSARASLIVGALFGTRSIWGSTCVLSDPLIPALTAWKHLIPTLPATMTRPIQDI